MLRQAFLSLAWIGLLCSGAASAENAAEAFHPVVPEIETSELRIAARQTPDQAGPDAMQVRRRTLGIILGSTAAVGLYGHLKWWQDGFTGNFRSRNEGWFGHNTYSGGADKLGHFFSNYALTRLSASAFKWAGNTSDASLKLAALTTLGIFTGVEILDGFSKEWSFSREDAIINALGVGGALLMETHPALDRLLDFRLLYTPSRESGGDFNPFGDYSGQTYLLVAKASGIPAFRGHPLLRYLELAVGYGTRGSSGDGPDDADIRRNVYVGISLNLSEVLRSTVFANGNAHPRLQNASDTFLEFVQVPGTAALIRHELD